MVKPTDDPLRALSQAAKQALVPSSPPEWVEPMLATLTKERFSDPDWIFERKLDGERCLAFRSGGEVRLLSRNRKMLNNHYPEIAAALNDPAGSDLVVDGEIVAFTGSQTDFSRLQRRMQISDPTQARRSGIAVFYYVFDIVHLDGFDLSHLALRDRKRLLRTSLSFGGPLRLTPHRNTAGEAYFAHACRSGWEGVVAKLANGKYVHRRSPQWLKFKCQQGQEFVIGDSLIRGNPDQASAPCCLASNAATTSYTPARWALGSTSELFATWGAASPLSKSTYPPSGPGILRRERGGCVRAWWARFDSASGRPTAGSAIPAFWVFVTTRRRETSSARWPCDVDPANVSALGHGGGLIGRTCRDRTTSAPSFYRSRLMTMLSTMRTRLWTACARTFVSDPLSVRSSITLSCWSMSSSAARISVADSVI